jgi:type 1 glutamine amidotransferase
MKRELVPLAWVAATMPVIAAGAVDARFPVRGLSIAAPPAAQVDRFAQFIDQALGPRGVNTLILRVDFNFQYQSHPDLGEARGLSRADVTKIVEACHRNSIRVIPQINLLGHQSWARTTGHLLRVHPEFDETPWVKMPEKYSWPNADRLYCKSYCPLHPQVHEVVFALVDELCDAFQTDAFHAGMDEVFYIGEDQCPRCGGRDKAELFAGEVKRIRDHLAEKGRKLWIWGDRLLDGTATGLGEWEASMNGTQRAIDLIPKDVTICDWHYDRADPTAAYFALKGFSVVTCPWKNPATAALQVEDIARLREQASPPVKARALGIVQTVWSGAKNFLDQYDRLTTEGAGSTADKTEAGCFVRTFEDIAALAGPAPVTAKRRHLLFIGQSKGYQHEAISSAMAMFYDLGRQSGRWDVCLRTDCTAITKAPLKWEAKNLDAYDAIIFYTDGDLDMDASQKADLLSFVRDEGKGLIGIHSAAITFVSWPEYGEMLGGCFDGHPWGQFDAPLVVEDRDFPGMRHLPRSFSLLDEIYQIKGFSRDNVRVLLSLDASKVDLKKEGVRRTDGDFAVIWARNFGKGRVLYNGLGHVPALWERPELRRMWTDMVLWATGEVAGDAAPRPSPAR